MKHLRKFYESIDSIIDDISKKGYISGNMINNQDLNEFCDRKPYIIEDITPKYLLQLLKKYVSGDIKFLPNPDGHGGRANYSVYEFGTTQSDLSWGGINDYLREIKYCLNFYAMEDEYFLLIGNAYIKVRDEFRNGRSFKYLIDGELNIEKAIINMFKGEKKHGGKWSFELPRKD